VNPKTGIVELPPAIRVQPDWQQNDSTANKRILPTILLQVLPGSGEDWGVDGVWDGD